MQPKPRNSGAGPEGRREDLVERNDDRSADRDPHRLVVEDSHAQQDQTEQNKLDRNRAKRWTGESNLPGSCKRPTRQREKEQGRQTEWTHDHLAKS